jgi:hypothetical protein
VSSVMAFACHRPHVRRRRAVHAGVDAGRATSPLSVPVPDCVEELGPRVVSRSSLGEPPSAGRAPGASTRTSAARGRAAPTSRSPRDRPVMRCRAPRASGHACPVRPRPGRPDRPHTSRTGRRRRASEKAASNGSRATHPGRRSVRASLPVTPHRRAPTTCPTPRPASSSKCRR